MKTNHFYQIIALSIGLMSTSLTTPFSPTINIPEIKFPETITIKPDFSGLGKELGEAGKESAKGIFTGAAEGLAEATESKEFGRAMRNIFGGASQQTTRAYTEAMRDPRLREQMREGARASTETMGIGAEEFSTGLREEVFPHLKRGFQDFFTSFINVENAIRWGAPVALGIALPLAGYYGSRVFWNALEKHLLSPKPAILNKKQKPVYGRADRMRRWWSGSKHQEMVFDPSIRNRLEEIEKKTTTLRDLIQSGKDRQYANLLLYGEPGTGKTLFAQVLAEKTNMDFLPVTAASLLQAGVEGIKYFDELITMANRSKYGTIIFVDEADALFIDRTKLDPSSDHYKVLNHILAIVDGRSNKFMVVAATNHAYLLDPAMGRRFQDRVLMPLPDTTTRKNLLELYAPQILFNVKQTSAKFVIAAKALFTPQFMAQVAEKTAGLSHAEIADMIEAMRNKAELNKRSLTIGNAQSAIDEAIEKRRRSEEDKKLREQRGKTETAAE